MARFCMLFGILVAGMCATSGNACSDFNKNCANWASRRYCTGTYEAYMTKYCRKSCKLCSTGGENGSTCGRTSIPQSRIISGVDAKPGAWPWMAALVRQSGSRLSHFCGASLITHTWVLTASHCVDQIKSYSSWKIKLGEHNHYRNEGTEQVMSIKRIIMHPEYTLRPRIWADVALIELTSPAKLNSRVTTVCLPKSREKPKRGSNCYLSGWGSIQHPGSPHHTLQQAKLPIVPTSKCVHSSEVVCAGFGRSSPVNACRGDSGGPLVCQQEDGSWVQHGIASFVVTYCKYYTGFAPVHKYRNWISQHVGN